MSDDDLLPLSAEALSMLDIERDRPGVPSDVPDRVFDHLTTSIALGSPGGGGGGGAGDGGGGGAGTRGLGRRLAGLLGAAIVGGGIGAAVHARLATPFAVVAVVAVAPSASETTVALPASVSPVAPRSEADASTIAVEALPTVPSAALARATASAHATTSALDGTSDVGAKDVDLGMERALIERARMASARGDNASALAALDRHAQDFPRGRLTEEREALAIQALVQAGRLEEARGRAARFRTRFPSSVFLAAISAALGAAP